MKKTTLHLVKALSEMSISITKINVNSICWNRCFQPKMPSGYDKLKK